MFRAFVHLVLDFEKGHKSGSVCVLIHVDIKFGKHHLLKMLSFCLKFESLDHCVSLFANIMLLLLLSFVVQFEIKEDDALISYDDSVFVVAAVYLFVCF